MNTHNADDGEPQRDDTGRPLFKKIILPCEMNDEERSDCAYKLTELALEIERIENLQKRIKGMREEITEIAHMIDSGVANRDVRCMVCYDTPKPGMKRIVRLDTDEVVEELRMTEADSQPGLFELADDAELKIPDGAKSR